MNENTAPARWRRFSHGFAVLTGAVVLTMACFLVLPLLQAISKRDQADMDLRSADTVAPPPPPPVVEEKQEEEKQEEQEKPQLAEDVQPLDLSQLELALSPGFGSGGLAGDFAINLQGLGGKDGNAEDLFDLADLDQKPRPVYQQQPRVTSAMRKKMPCTVYILFTVTETGRVQDPVVQSSDDPMFDGPALAAIKQWKFEPGKRGGQAVSFRMRQPMTFK